MKFFYRKKEVVYPDSYDALKARILHESISGPTAYPIQFFEDHFDNGGNKVHPILGSLDELANAIDDSWGLGMQPNSVSTHLRVLLRTYDARVLLLTHDAISVAAGR